MEKHKIYDEDFYGWTNEQAELLEKGDYEHMDILNLIEEILCLGRSQTDKLESHLEIFFIHMLKKKYQPEKETRSWNLSIKNSRERAIKTLRDNPSLKHKLNEIINTSYSYARTGAAQETGLEEYIFPKECLWTIEEILDSDPVK